MKNNRRNFLKLTGLAGFSMAGASILQGFSSGLKSNNTRLSLNYDKKSHVQRFNMSGYAAPKLNTVRIGVIGLGGRGASHVVRMTKIEGVEIKGLCDLLPERANATKKLIKDSGHNPAIYTGNKEEWQKLCEREDIDLVLITTPWHMHASMAVYAMNHGKHVASEVPAAGTLEECWQLVETSERTRKHCMMMQNTCYDSFQLLTLNMARQGFFGEIVHADCAYNTSKMKNNFSKDRYWNMWWLKQYANRKGNIYPTHGLGPVCQIMDINRGDKMDYLVSVESNDFMMAEMARKLASTDEFFKPYVDKDFRGNMNTTTIRTTKGRTIMLQHDASSPRPHTKIHGIYGTKGSALEYPLPARISTGLDGWVSPEEFKLLEEKYTPNIVKKIGKEAKRIGGHGGMDFLMSWRLIDCLRNGLPLDMDVYDAAALSSVLPLSEWSVNNHSNSIDVPDFTAGAWKKNQANMDISLEKGGNTNVRK